MSSAKKKPSSMRILRPRAIKKSEPVLEKSLLESAQAVKGNAYAPYSEFRVGAAVLGDDDRRFVGVNVENKSYGLTVCAERNAVAAAVVSGITHIKAVAIASDAEPPAPPCGACREVLAEFNPDMNVLLVGSSRQVVRYKLSDLLPTRFVFKPRSK